MTIETGLDPVSALAIVGVLGVGAQWVAWRMQIPAIVLMLAAGIIAGPVSGILDPMRDLGTLMGPLISIAVAVILFEGGADVESAKPKWRRNRCLSFGVDRCARRVAFIHIGAALCSGVRVGVCHRVWRHHDRDRPHGHRTAAASGKAGQTPRRAFAMGSDCK